MGPNGILLAQLAMAQISAATGITVKFVGTSHQIPFQTEQHPAARAGRTC